MLVLVEVLRRRVDRLLRRRHAAGSFPAGFVVMAATLVVNLVVVRYERAQADG